MFLTTEYAFLPWLSYTVPVCVCVCKGRLCDLMGNGHKDILGSKLIKALEQMVQTWFGHNETVSGETNRTWQDSCEGFVRWLEFRHLQPREWNYNGTKTFETLFKKQLNKAVFTSSKRVFAEQRLLEVNYAMPTGCFCLLFFVSHPQSFDLGRWILVNTKSSTPVARAFSCLPTLTNPALTDTLSPLSGKLWNKQLWHYQSGCFFPGCNCTTTTRKLKKAENS